MSSKTLGLIISILLAVLILPFLLSQIDLNLLFETFSIINPIYIFLAFFSYSSTYFLRTLRFCILINREIKFLDMFKIVCLHNMLNNLLPARTGELSFIYLLKKFHNKNVEKGFAILITARVFDCLSILLLFLISAFLLGFGLEMIFFIFFVSFSVLAVLFFKFIRKLNTDVYIANGFFSPIFKIIKRITDGFRSINLKKPELLKVMLLTLLIWIFQYLTVQLILKSISLDITLLKAIFGSTFAIITTILPIQGIAGFGSFEGGWTFGFILTGHSKDLAIISGFLFHISILIYSLTLGIFPTIYLIFSHTGTYRDRN